jgi:hypothetical protein
MTLHPPKPKPVPRPVYLFCGIPITVQFSRRPRVLRLEASKAQSRGRGLKI